MAAPITTTYSPEAREQIVEHVLAQLSTGRSVSRILREDDGMPSADTFWRWTVRDPQLSENIGRAREHGVEALLDEVIDIVDDATDDVEIVYAGQGDNRSPTARINGKAIRRASLQAEYRVKMAQMIAPRRYGPKLDLTSAGEKLAPTQVNDNRLQALVSLAADRKLKALPKEQTDEEIDPLS